MASRRGSKNSKEGGTDHTAILNKLEEQNLMCLSGGNGWKTKRNKGSKEGGRDK